MPEIIDNPSIFGDLYEGWVEYRKKIRGYMSTPNKQDIQDWEQFKYTILERIKNAKKAS